MIARELANKLATVQERAISALPNLPELPWRRRGPTLPASLAVFGLGLVLGFGIGLLLYAGAAADAEGAPRAADGEANAEPHGGPIQ
jgi:hypothetical protein